MNFPALDAAKAEKARLSAEFDGIQNKLKEGQAYEGLKERSRNLVRAILNKDEHIEELERVRSTALNASATGDAESGDGASSGAPSVPGRHDLARRVVDGLIKARRMPEAAGEKIDGLLGSGSAAEQSLAARWVVDAGDPNYYSAFMKLLADPARGHVLWSPQEQAAYARVQGIKAALSTGAGAGGEMIPITLDPTIMLTSDGSINPLRRIARVVQTVTGSWKGVTSAGVSAEWKAEGDEAADASPTLAEAEVPVHFGDAFVPYSFEVEMDALAFGQELAKLLADASDQLMATAYTTGSGAGQPAGVITGLAGGGSQVTGDGAEALDDNDPVKLQNALPPRFQAQAQWCAHLAIINTIGSFETTNGSLRYPEVAQSRLLRRTLNELSNMDGSINPAATADNRVLLYGDFQAGFIIADRIGSTVEIIPNLVGANRRPTGQRGVMLWFRTGSKVVIPEAFRLLNVPTTA